MIILSFSDIHGDHKKFKKISDEIKDADLIILAGDITHFGKEKETIEVLNNIRKYNKNIYAVSGNCDYPEVEKTLKKENVNLHKRSRVFNGIFFTGCSYSLITPFNTPCEFAESDIKKFIDRGYSDHNGEKSVFVVHQPPYDTGTDILRNGRRSGSVSVRDCIEERKPVLCLTGHIHESPSIERFCETQLVNPGPFFKGRYARIELDEGTVNNAEIINI